MWPIYKKKIDKQQAEGLSMNADDKKAYLDMKRRSMQIQNAIGSGQVTEEAYIA